MQTNVLEYLEHTVRRCPEKTAFADDKQGLTFRQLYDQARAIGSYLYREGLYGQGVAVFLKKQPRTIAAFLGAIYGGSFYVPLDEEMPRQRIELIFKTLQPGAVICDENTEALVSGLDYGGKCIRYENAAFGIIDEEALARVRREQLDIDPIYVVFTSGSTGVPKGVTGCHRSCLDYIESLCEVLPFSKDTVFGNQTPLYFDACLKEIMPTLKYGATTYLIPRKLFLFPIDLVKFLNRFKINTLCWVVSALTYLSSFQTFEKVKPEFVDTVAFASEVFPVRQLNIWRKALPNTRFFNLYGPTETTGICCYYEVDREFHDDEVLPIGRPFHNTQILLLDEQNRLARQGEICIRGSRLTLGYYRDMKQTEDAFVQNPLNSLYPERIYRTGDMGKYNDRGELVFLSRKDHQIKHMGHRIEPGEIEAAANRHREVTGACCVFQEQAKKIVLYYVGSVNEAALAAHLAALLPRYMLPGEYNRLDAMPLTPNGKIDRNLLKQWQMRKEK